MFNWFKRRVSDEQMSADFLGSTAGREHMDEIARNQAVQPPKAMPDPERMPDVPRDPDPTYYCSFCGKRNDEVKKLIAGPVSFICDECVPMCVSILKKQGIDVREEPPADPTLFSINDRVVIYGSKLDAGYSATRSRYHLVTDPPSGTQPVDGQVWILVVLDTGHIMTYAVPKYALRKV